MSKELMKKDLFDKDTTYCIKGIALIFMFIHHFFTFPNWYLPNIQYPELTQFANFMNVPSEICISIFAFLTGYFYFYNKEKTFKYSLKKIVNILIPYTIIFLIILIISILIGKYNFEIIDVIKEFLGLKDSLMCFGWYVPFYIVSMLILPIIVKISKNNTAKTIILGIILPVVVYAVLKYLLQNNTKIFILIRCNLMFFPCIISGLLFAKSGLFDKIDKILKNKAENRILIIIILISITVIAFCGRKILMILTINSTVFKNIVYCINLDILYTPFFVYGMSRLINLLKLKKINTILIQIGKYSLCMWLWHCIFFNTCKYIFQPILYFPHNPLLVLVWGLIISYMLSIGLKHCIEKVCKIIKKVKNE